MQKRYVNGYMWLAVFSEDNSFAIRRIHQTLVQDEAKRLKESGLLVFGPAWKFSEVYAASNHHLDSQINALKEISSRLKKVRQHNVQHEG